MIYKTLFYTALTILLLCSVMLIAYEIRLRELKKERNEKVKDRDSKISYLSNKIREYNYSSFNDPKDMEAKVDNIYTLLKSETNKHIAKICKYAIDSEVSIPIKIYTVDINTKKIQSYARHAIGLVDVYDDVMLTYGRKNQSGHETIKFRLSKVHLGYDVAIVHKEWIKINKVFTCRSKAEEYSKTLFFEELKEKEDKGE